MVRTRAQKLPDISDTADLLLQAAKAEFCQHGFFATDSNKIARRAGFAPQTFYRWYRDKTAIFIAVYRAWEEEELALVFALFAARAPYRHIVDAIIQHHREHRLFRRSLRQLAVEDPTVRAARAASRRRQIEQIRSQIRSTNADTLLVALLQIERLADAVAEDELRDLGASEEPLRAVIVDILARHAPPA